MGISSWYKKAANSQLKFHEEKVDVDKERETKNMVLIAFRNGEEVGTLEYYVDLNSPNDYYIWLVDVPVYKREGIATALWDEFYRRHGHHNIDTGFAASEDGIAFMESVGVI